jgi:glycosyltransferase involved in cell wall biosynthesis
MSNARASQTMHDTLMPSLTSSVQIAVLVPCYNEEATIAAVVKDFFAALPHCLVFVYDNNSSDKTVAKAVAAGAIVRYERMQGKGNVLRRMLADVEADVYVVVDGDATYDASACPAMIERLLSENLDMINGMRIATNKEAYRPGHRFGNALLTGLIKSIFGTGLDDILSGYKVMSRRFVKSMPLLSGGFETESELAIHALSLRMPIAEVPTDYRDRPRGSDSKLRTYSDGFRILRTIVWLMKEERPLLFFSIVSGILAVMALIIVEPVVATFLSTGLVPRLPTAVLAASIMLLSFLSLSCGLILDTVTRGRREMKRMVYLATPRTSLRAAAKSD